MHYLNLFVIPPTGPQDERGYFEAQVGGKVGLVPVSYVMALPTPPSRPTPVKRVTMQTRPHSISGVDTSPEQILDMHQQLQRAHSHHHHGKEERERESHHCYLLLQRSVA